MRKNLKRIVSVLLAMVMILAMLPVIGAASDGYEVVAIEGIPDDNQAVVIYSASAGGFFGYGATGGSVGVSAAITNEESSSLKIPDGTGIYKFIKNTDGTYYLTNGGKYLTVNNEEKLSMSDTAVVGTRWKITAATGADFNGYTISSADCKYGSKEIFLEFYTAFKAWTCSAVTAIYTFNFYSVDASVADPDNDGYVGKMPTSGILPEDGKTYVIFNENAGMTFGPQSDDATSPSMTGVVSDYANDVLTPGNGSLIFTVHKEGNYYSFENNGKYLRTAPNVGTTNAETIYMDALDADYSWWRIEACTGGYILYNKTAKWNSNSVCIEYFSNSFSGWTYNGSTHLFAMKFFAVEDTFSLGQVLSPKVNVAANDAFVGIDYKFSFSLDDLLPTTSLKVEYSTDDTTFTEVTPTKLATYDYEATVPLAALAGKTSLTLKISAANEKTSYAGTTKVTIKDEPLIDSVSPLPNAATGSEKRPEIVANIANCGSNPKVTMTIDGAAVTPTVTASKISYKPATNMTDDRHIIELTITRADGKQTSMIWSFFVGEAGMSLYFGQMHSHTAEYSDGAGTLEDAFEHAMKAEDIDYLFVTDHSNYFDTTSTAKATSYYDLSSLTKGNSLSKWEEARATAAEYNAKSDDFIAAYGYEMTWSGGPGHTNTFNTYGTVSRNNSDLNNKNNSYAGMHLYNDLMVNANNGADVDGAAVAEGVKTKYIDDAPVVSQFNHPGTTFGTFDNYAGYTPIRDVVLNLIEVGNGEGAVGGSSYWPSYSEYDKCLAKGWHVAPTNNQDNHKGKWGDSNTCRDVVITDNFTEAGLYEAMAERRVYATEDQNLRIYYYLNEQLMGSIIDVGMEEPENVSLNISVSDPDGEKLGKIEVIGENGLVLKSYTAAGSTFEKKDTIKNTDAYYYIKVTQADGDIAVTAPVWLGAATPITAEVKTDAALSVKGQSEHISSTITNGAPNPYEITKVRFILEVDGVEKGTIYTDTTKVTLGAGESKTYEFDYVRTLVGEQTIRVIYYGEYQGDIFKVQAYMEQKSYNPKDLVNVAVDRGHDNYYVSGDYAGSMGNFIEYAAQNGVQVKYIEAGEFTYENLSKYEMVVLTVNYVRNTRKAVDYTADEIAALAKYAEKGGKIILCSKSDRDNKFDNCAENSNKLLEAIKANTRVVNGIIVDNDLKANEAYRIYFSSIDNFNTEHRFVKGAYTASNAFGTQPDPSNQTGFQMYNGAPIEILDESKVEVLVKGYSSTWGSHYDGYFDGSSFVPNYDPNNATTTTVEKGKVNIMTYEDLAGGGWLITSGVTFLSNYDIKSDADYANKYIVYNIIDELTDDGKEEKITPISTVKKVPADRSGEEYSIEGYVTSNASAYDQDTAFFDCIYVQDKSGNGINCFPVAGNYAIGMNVRCHGGVTYYCGEVELNLGTDYDGYIKVISDDTAVIAPLVVNCKEAMSTAAIGNLMKVSGVVTGIHKTADVIDKIYVRDNSGEACLFINGYIMKDYKGLDDLCVGMKVSGIGIGSRDVDETSATSAIFARLRVRDRSEIVILNSEIDVVAAFKDVQKGAWYVEAVQYAVKNGLLNGVSNGQFAPDSTLTRAMVATVLYRLAGEPEATGNIAFTDVVKGSWYDDAVTWAAGIGIVNGVGDNQFAPNKAISRQEMAAMLARYAKNFAGKDTTPKGNLNAYPDKADVSTWATDALTWCVDNGIINGMNGKLAPKSNATRAQFATIIMRFAELKN